MKRILAITFAVLFLMLGTLPAMSGKGGSTIMRPVIPMGGNTGSLRPKVPTMQEIECSYEGEELTVSFTVPEGESNLTVFGTPDGTELSYTFDTTEPATFEIGEFDSLEIQITTARGNVYEGVIE